VGEGLEEGFVVSSCFGWYFLVFDIEYREYNSKIFSSDMLFFYHHVDPSFISEKEDSNLSSSMTTTEADSLSFSPFLPVCYPCMYIYMYSDLYLGGELEGEKKKGNTSGGRLSEMVIINGFMIQLSHDITSSSRHYLLLLHKSSSTNTTTSSCTSSASFSTHQRHIR
jgi:hypothetical protein